MRAHELGRKLLGGPDIEVVIVEQQESYRLYWTVDEVVEVEKKPKDGDIDVPYLELQ